MHVFSVFHCCPQQTKLSELDVGGCEGGVKGVRVYPLKGGEHRPRGGLSRGTTQGGQGRQRGARGTIASGSSGGRGGGGDRRRRMSALQNRTRERAAQRRNPTLQPNPYLDPSSSSSSSVRKGGGASSSQRRQRQQRQQQRTSGTPGTPGVRGRPQAASSPAAPAEGPPQTWRGGRRRARGRDGCRWRCPRRR